MVPVLEQAVRDGATRHHELCFNLPRTSTVRLQRALQRVARHSQPGLHPATAPCLAGRYRRHERFCRTALASSNPRTMITGCSRPRRRARRHARSSCGPVDPRVTSAHSLTALLRGCPKSGRAKLFAPPKEFSCMSKFSFTVRGKSPSL